VLVAAAAVSYGRTAGMGLGFVMGSGGFGGMYQSPGAQNPTPGPHLLCLLSVESTSGTDQSLLWNRVVEKSWNSPALRANVKAPTN
jgi:hypothetical protein